jgi:cupin superfamily acireductone dioxygenase involved in methionine salvage
MDKPSLLTSKRKAMTDAHEPKFLCDPYLDWAEAEGIPMVEDFGVDLNEVETRPWARMGLDGALVHLKGRGDFLCVFVLDLPPGGKSAPQRHVFEEVVYVLEGQGSTTIKTHDGQTHSFEWSQGGLFALPLNATYQHFNGSGKSRARLSSTNNLPMVLNLFHNDAFVFDNSFDFVEREGKETFFSGEGDFIPKTPGRHMWETNFIPDLRQFELVKWEKRGAGGSNMMFVLADGTMHAHSSEMPVGTYKKAHRHGADFHVSCITGTGYSLLWYEDDAEFVRVDWDHGVVFAPPDGMYHQHFNTSPTPARYLAIALGGLRYPMVAEKRAVFMGMDVNVRDGGAQIEYEDQDARIHEIYLEALRENGVDSGMGRFLQEN